MNYLLLIAIIIPLVIGLITRLIGNKTKLAKCLALTGTVITTLFVLSFIIIGKDNGAFNLTLVNFNESLSLSLHYDGLSRFFSILVAVLWPFAVIYAFVYLKHDENQSKYYGYYLMTYGVVLGIAFASNALTMYIFYEGLTFLTLPLITHTQTKEARKAGRIYLYYSLSGSSLALAGIVIITVLTGNNNFISGGLLNFETNMAQFAYLLTFFGFGVKAAIFPLCKWLPIASAAPTPTTALLHAVAVVKSGAFAIIRMTYYSFSYKAISGSIIQYVVLFVISITIIFGSMKALKEQHFKRRFAYSTVANLSYILFGALLCTPDGLYASLFHFIMHSITKIVIFFIVGAVIESSDAHYIFELNGFSKKMPIAFFFYIISGLSLIGIPPFGGFISKYYLVSSGISNGSAMAWFGVAAIIISAILTSAYVLTIVFRAYFRKPNEESISIYEKAKEPSVGFLVVIGFFAILSLLSGIFSSYIGNYISSCLGGII